jgi:YD repeat-containing protein
VYRLIEENIMDPAIGEQTIAYAYDPAGNRLTKTDSAGTINYTYDANDRLITESGPAGSFTYSYDANGNTIAKTDSGESIVYAYDFENRLINIESPTSNIGYAYDADGIRVSQTVNGSGTAFTVDKNRDYAQVLEERDTLGSLTVQYTYGDDLISQNRGGAESYCHYDGLGSIRALTDAAGTQG